MDRVDDCIGVMFSVPSVWNKKKPAFVKQVFVFGGS